MNVELVKAYDWNRKGKVYRIEIMRVGPGGWFAYVSDAAENVYRTRDTETERRARRAAYQAIREDRVGLTRTGCPGPAPIPVGESQRRAIQAFLAHHERCGTGDVARHLEVPFSVALKALQQLAGGGLIARESIRKAKSWSHRWSLPAALMDKHLRRADPGDRMILAAIEKSPSIETASLSVDVGRPQASVWRALQRLRDAGAIVEARSSKGKSSTWTIAAKASEVV